jgi:maleate isomerase
MSPRIGVIVPFDAVLDREYWELVPRGTTVHLTRTEFFAEPYGVKLAERGAAATDVATAARSLSAIKPDVIAFACTASSFVLGIEGERRLRAAIEAGGQTKAVSTSGGLLSALKALGARKVALGTPYDAELGERLRTFVAEAGFEPVSLVNLDTDLSHLGESDESVVVDLAKAAIRPDADVLFLSCTNLPTLGLLPSLQQRFGVPVLAANQVTMWAALRAAGVHPGSEFGSLESVADAALAQAIRA